MGKPERGPKKAIGNIYIRLLEPAGGGLEVRIVTGPQALSVTELARAAAELMRVVAQHAECGYERALEIMVQLAQQTPAHQQQQIEDREVPVLKLGPGGVFVKFYPNPNPN